MASDRNRFPHKMTFKELIIYIISTIVIGLFLFFIRGDEAGRLGAFIVCPLLIIYLIYAYRKENRADQNALQKGSQIAGGEYFESPEWHTGYLTYINEHPFERPEIPDLKKDLLKRFRRGNLIIWMVFFLFLMFCSVCAAFSGSYIISVVGIIIFGILFYMVFSEYTGMPVRRWLKGDIDYDALNASYKNSRLLTYKKNGFAFGSTHIHAFTEKKVYAVDYRLVEGISRKIVRLKKYEDGIYLSDEYQNYAVIHVRLPESGGLHDVEIELNEFQVQMVIDNLMRYKPRKSSNKDISMVEKKENINV